jgi:hypothetical protein
VQKVTPLPLAVAGLAFVTLSWGTCNVVVVDELYSWILVLTFFGGLIGGGAAFAGAALRYREPLGAEAEVARSRGLAVAGISLALGAAGVAWAGSPIDGTPAALLGAIFILGVALTIGAVGLLAWAVNGPHSIR